METRFDRVQDLVRAQLEVVTDFLSQQLQRPPAGVRDGDPFAVWNPCSSGAARVEAELELDLPGLDPASLRAGRRLAAHVRDVAGRAIPARVEVVSPGARWETTFSLPLARAMVADLPRELMGFHANAVSWSRDADRLTLQVVMGSEPRGDFDLAATRRGLAQALAAADLHELVLDVRRPARLRVAFVDSLPGHGLRVYRLARGRMPREQKLASGRLPGGGAFVENAAWRVEADADGSVTLVPRRGGAAIRDALRIVSEGDRGDTYNFDPVPGGEICERPYRARVRVEHASAAEASLALELRLRVPRGLAGDRTRRSAERVELPVSLRLRVSAGLDRVDVSVRGRNTAQDHRLRLHVRAPFVARRLEVESAFEVAERPIAPSPDAFGSPHPAEFPVGAGPQRSFATVCDGEQALTVAARGNSEVEAMPEPDGRTSLAVTLLRAVGWLSGSDLALRPGPAGPLFPTPGAQVPGPFRADVSLRLHPDGCDSRLAEAHRFAHPPAAFAPGEGAGQSLADGARLVVIDDPALVVSALEPGADGALHVRLYEASGASRRMRGRVPGARALRAVDLAGRDDSGLVLEASGDAFSAELRGAQLVDLEARFASPS